MELTECSATELLNLYRSGEVSPVEATQEIVDRAESLQPTINAFVKIEADEALASARQSEKRWVEHRRSGSSVGVLEGVPVSMKDVFLVKGWPTLKGSRAINPDQPWDVDAPCTARIREAGGVIFGRTTTPEFACKGETNSALSGFTRNPWDTTRSPGGSSGGSAAAVAAGLGPVSMGTDGGGSIRIPSAFCGVVGFKPSFGRVPAFPPSPYGNLASVGPQTMTVRDAALTMNVVTRPDPRDWTSLPYDATDYLRELDDGIAGMRIAYSPDLGYGNVDAEVAALVEAAVSQLEALGAIVEQVDPGFEDPLHILTGLWFVGSKTIFDGLSAEGQALTDPDFAAQAQLGAQFTTSDVQDFAMRRNALGTHMRLFMTHWDALVTPSVAITAFESLPPGHAPMSPETLLSWSPFTYPFNLTQQPAITIPCGLASNGLPVGMQIVGPAYGDAQVLRIAQAYESTRPLMRASLGPAHSN